ncbi:MAG: hypothetical protein FVQ77_13360, partial [Cytophagales bacterium]|nr:hypothetical protein [Cytophagales bacterium]
MKQAKPSYLSGYKMTGTIFSKVPLLFRYILLPFFLLMSSYNANGMVGCTGDPNYPFPNFCHKDVPSFIVDLRGDPDSIWNSPPLVRNSCCCAVAANFNCVEFWVYMDENAALVNFICTAPPCPSGMSVFIDCDVISPTTWGSGVPTCLTGNPPGVPYHVSACKNGTDPNTIFTIQSIKKQEIYDDTAFASFTPAFKQCLRVTGYDSMQVAFVSPDTIQDYTFIFGDPYASGGTVTAPSSPFPGGSFYALDDTAVTGTLWNPLDTIWHTYDSLGEYTLCLTQIVAGCEITICGTVTNDRASTAKANTLPDSGCSPLNVTLFDSSIFTVIWDILWGDGDSTMNITDQDTTNQVLDPFPQHTYTNSSAISDTFYYFRLITNSKLLCPDTLFDTVTVHPKPVAGFTYTTSGDQCSPVPYCFTNTSVGKAPLSYLWVFGNGDSSTAINPCEQFENLDFITKFYTITLYVTSPDGCADTVSVTIAIFPVFNANFIATPDTGCSPLTVNFAFTGIDTAALDTLIWDFGDGPPMISGNGNEPSITELTHTYTNTSTGDTCYTVTMIARFEDGGCTDTATRCIFVHPKPIAYFTVDVDTGCTPLLVTICPDSIGVQTFYWSYGDIGPVFEDTFTTTGCFTHTYVNTSNNNAYYPLTLIVENAQGCRDTFSLPITVFPSVIAAFTGDSIGCEPWTVNFVAVNTYDSANYNWNFGDAVCTPQPSCNQSNLQNPTHTFNVGVANATDTFITQLVVDYPGFCSDTVQKTIIVYPKPTAYFRVSDTIACSPPFFVTIDSFNTGVDSVYIFCYGDGFCDTITTDTVIIHGYQNTSNTTVCYNTVLIVQNTSNCTDTFSRQICVRPDLVVNFNPIPDTGCSPLTVQFFDATLPDSGNTFQWVFGDAVTDTVQNPLHTYTNASCTLDTNFYVTFIVTSPFGCSDTTYDTILVHPKPCISTFFATSFGCTPLNSTLLGSATGSLPLTYNLDYEGDGSDDFTDTGSFFQSFTYTNTTNLPIFFQPTLVVESNFGCDSVRSLSVTVLPEVTAIFSTQPDTFGCHPYTVNFENNSTGEGPAAPPYRWDFGDATPVVNDTNPTHTFGNPSITFHDSIYCVSLIVTGFPICSDTATQCIVVHPKPLANFGVDTNQGCSPLTVTITNNSLGVDSVIWDFGDGSAVSNDTSTVTTHTYVNNSDTTKFHILKLIVLNNDGCSDTLIDTITVHPEIFANFTLTPGSVGCHPLTVNFFNLSLGDDSSFWNYGDYSLIDSTVNPTHIFYGDTSLFTSDSIYYIELFVKSKFGCGSDTARDTILVHPQPFACFTVDTTEGFSPLTINISNCALGYDSLLWVFGDVNTDDTTALNFDYIYINNSDSTVVYLLCLYPQTQFGCTDTLCIPITVHPVINADFTMLPDSFGCHPFTVEFVNLSAGADTFYWDYGDGGKDTTYNKNDRPVHQFLNSSSTNDTTFCVTLIAVSKFNSRDTVVKCVLVHPKPIANFTVDNDTGCSCFTVTITNLSAGFDTLTWDFGDGSPVSTDTGTTIVHTYCNTTDSTVNYILRLIAETQYGCTDTLTDTIRVEPEITANFSTDDDIDTTGCDPYTVIFTNQSTGASTYYWGFGDGDTSTLKDPTNTFLNASCVSDTTFCDTLIATSVFGCSDTIVKCRVVYPKPVINTFTVTSFGCSPLNTTLIVTSCGADSLYWDFGDNDTIKVTPNDDTLYHTYTNVVITSPQFYTPCMRIVNNEGCSDTLCKSVTVLPEVTAIFSTQPDTFGCHPYIANFENFSLGAATYAWDFGNTNTSAAFEPTDTFLNLSNTFHDSIYTVRLIATAIFPICIDTAYAAIVVHPKPAAIFSVDTNTGCSPFTVTITNLSVGEDSVIWDFGDGSPLSYDTSAVIIHTYINNSDTTKCHILRLIVFNNDGCSDMLTDTICVHPEIDADFIMTPDTNGIGCHPFAVCFFNLSLGEDFYDWDFGDGTSDITENPCHTFSNTDTVACLDSTFIVELVVSSIFGCGSDTARDTILEHPKPVARFTAIPDTGCSPLTVTITNLAKCYDTLRWDFGDGSPVDDTTAAFFDHVYTNFSDTTKFHTLCLTAKTQYGCTDTICTTIVVHPEISAGFTMTPDTSGIGCHPFAVCFFNLSLGEDFYDWDFGDGITDTSENPCHTFSNTDTSNNKTDSIYYISLVVSST